MIANAYDLVAIEVVQLPLPFENAFMMLPADELPSSLPVFDRYKECLRYLSLEVYVYEHVSEPFS